MIVWAHYDSEEQSIAPHFRGVGPRERTCPACSLGWPLVTADVNLRKRYWNNGIAKYDPRPLHPPRKRPAPDSRREEEKD